MALGNCFFMQYCEKDLIRLLIRASSSYCPPLFGLILGSILSKEFGNLGPPKETLFSEDPHYDLQEILGKYSSNPDSESKLKSLLPHIVSIFGANKSLNGVMKIEYRIDLRSSLRSDFAEGVRAVLADKDQDTVNTIVTDTLQFSHMIVVPIGGVVMDTRYEEDKHFKTQSLIAYFPTFLHMLLDAQPLLLQFEGWNIKKIQGYITTIHDPEDYRVGVVVAIR
ncbi:hypothetical protein L2E82_37494 [Cichorium intybus]|uniref:Uncharacterized protein n=1 Tax=Cichorium intybus TaxID=13427 RepID=A0ACB9AEN9_CICIN|nr:hypothetical protein L2E82_37494 [Cichorium intybus]